jgi:hypothetical protein
MPAPLPRRAPRLKGPIPRIRRTPVRSTSIRGIGYDEATHTLDVQFAGGGIYRYDGVEAALYEELKVAESPGRFLNERVRGNFRCHRIG